MIPRDQLSRLLPLIPTLPEAQAGQLLAGLAEELTTACASDGLLWLKFVRTRDEADPEWPVKAFPLSNPYLSALWSLLYREPKVIIAKSRQMLVSWLVAAFLVWWARYHANQACYYQTKAHPDAVSMVAMPEGGFEGRCQFIESHLPPWMQRPCKISEGRIQYRNGSMIQALAGGADQIRGKTCSVVVEDEFAFQEDQDGVYTALTPLIQKGAKAILISTPNGSANMFATVWHGHPVGGAPK